MDGQYDYEQTTYFQAPNAEQVESGRSHVRLLRRAARGTPAESLNPGWGLADAHAGAAVGSRMGEVVSTRGRIVLRGDDFWFETTLIDRDDRAKRYRLCVSADAREVVSYVRPLTEVGAGEARRSLRTTEDLTRVDPVRPLLPYLSLLERLTSRDDLPRSDGECSGWRARITELGTNVLAGVPLPPLALAAPGTLEVNVEARSFGLVYTTISVQDRLSAPIAEFVSVTRHPTADSRIPVRLTSTEYRPGGSTIWRREEVSYQQVDAPASVVPRVALPPGTFVSDSRFGQAIDYRFSSEADVLDVFARSPVASEEALAVLQQIRAGKEVLENQAGLRVEPSTIFAGTVDAGAVRQLSFLVSNTADRPMEARLISASCSCLEDLPGYRCLPLARAPNSSSSGRRRRIPAWRWPI